MVNAYKYLRTEKQEFVLSKQMLRSCTSIGAQSPADFLHKLSISYKEARETLYWLKLLQATNYLADELAQSLLNDCTQICKITGKIQISTARNS